MLKKLIKFFSYKKRVERVKDKILKRVFKTYPNFPMFNYSTGERVFPFIKLTLEQKQLFDPITGKLLSSYKKSRLLLSKTNDERCRNWHFYYEFDKNAFLLDHDDPRLNFGSNFYNIPKEEVNRVFDLYLSDLKICKLLPYIEKE